MLWRATDYTIEQRLRLVPQRPEREGNLCLVITTTITITITTTTTIVIITIIIIKIIIIIYVKKLLDSDWLRAVQFKCNTSAKSVTPVQITHRNSGL